MNEYERERERDMRVRERLLDRSEIELAAAFEKRGVIQPTLRSPENRAGTLVDHKTVARGCSSLETRYTPPFLGSIEIAVSEKGKLGRIDRSRSREYCMP